MTVEPRNLEKTLSALANPTRRAILVRLRSGEATVGELAAPFDMSQPAISRHIRVLEEAGLVTRGREAQTRPCRLNGDPLADLAEWVEEFRDHWEGSFRGLGRLLDKLHAMEVKLGGGGI